MLRFIPLLMTLTALLAPVAETQLKLSIYNDPLHEPLKLRCRDSDNRDLEHNIIIKFWLNRTKTFREPEQIQFNSTQSHYSELYVIEHDSKQLMPIYLNEPWYLHALHATGTRFVNAMPYYYYREADFFQLLAIHNRFSLHAGLELMSVKVTYSRWTMKSATIISCHWYEDFWHHPLCKSARL